MPKFGKNFDAQLVVNCEVELKSGVIAFSYLKGDNGQVSGIVRNLLQSALSEAVENLDPHERRDYNKILENVKIENRMIIMKKRDPARAKQSADALPQDEPTPAS